MTTDMPEQQFRDTYGLPSYWTVDMSTVEYPVRICQGNHHRSHDCEWEEFIEGMPGLGNK